VRTALAEIRPMERTIPASGTLASQERSTLGARVAGPLERLAVDLGSVVREGDLLAQVEARTYELRLAQARAALGQARAALGLPEGAEGGADEAGLDIESVSSVRSAHALLAEAEKSRERLRSLSGTGVASQAEVDAVEAAHTVARTRLDAARDEARTRLAAVAQRRAELAIAEKQLADTRIVAPYAGAVQERLASVGEYLSVGAPVVTLVRIDPLRLRLEIPEREAAALRPGQRVRLRVEGSAAEHEAVLARIAPALDPTSRMLTVEADVPNSPAAALDGDAPAAPPLRPGLFARARVVLDERESTLCVPERAIIAFAGLEKVVAVAEEKAREIAISTGRRAGGWVEVTAGLEAGTAVVLDPAGVRTGAALRVIEGPPGSAAPTAAPAPEPGR